MIYFIAEDMNSAHKFWKTVLDTFSTKYVEINKNDKGQIVYGNTSLDSKVDIALKVIKPGDTLFVAFDNIGSPLTPNNQAFDAGDFINNTNAKCMMKQVNFYITNYYCFEEIYITYDELEDMCKKDGNSKLAEVINHVKTQIYNNREYFDKNNTYIKYVISIAKDAGKNKEHFTNVLLYQATKSIEHGYFAISKKKGGFGICWINDCNIIINKNMGSNLNYFCYHCKYSLKKRGVKEKLVDLNKRTILKYASTNFIDLSKL